jgi:outer membrane receptor protein involved in Fe transport
MPFKRLPLRGLLLACAAIGALTAAAPVSAAPAAADAVQAYDLQPQSLEAALRAVALRSGRAILAPSSLLAGKSAPRLKGDYTATRAARALLAGSGLQVEETGDALIVRTAPGGASQAPSAPEPTAGAGGEVMVTGTRLRGAEVAAPVDVITRTDIEQTGYAAVGDVIRSLPEDWAGGQSPGVLPGAGLSNQSNQNTTGASTVNLRGLGTDATLVLVDGQRLSAEGEFQAADISVIPLAAIQRIDVVTDGASALYGSDAVAGVANFILRKDFDGAELSETLGGATDGGGFEQDYNLLVGKTWSGGHVLASVESLHQDQIAMGQRDFTATAAPGDALLDAQNRLSLFASVGQDLTSWASFHMDGLYSERATGDQWQAAPGATTYRYATKVRSYYLAPGLDFTLPGTWTASLDGVVSASRDSLPIYSPGDAYYSAVANNADSVEFSANGDVFRLPGGAVKLALGGGYLAQGYDYTQSIAAPQSASREVGYVFGEASAPLVSPDPTRLGLNALDLTLAGRIEHYSDFGWTSNPKVGLRYQPIPGLALRGTWGTSFKAPEFSQEALPLYAYLYPAAAMGGGAGTSLLAYGGNAALKPERATSWTVGADWSPQRDPGLTVSATYFDIDYTDRIVQPVADPFVALSNPLYAPFVILGPTPGQVSGVVDGASSFVNLSGMPYNPASVAALVEDHFVNATAQTIHGVDLSIRQSLKLPLGTLDVSAAATWLNIAQKLLPGSPEQTLTGTLFNPPTLRFRGGLTWVYGGFSATGTVNYISPETDTNVTPNAPISAWTTVDAVVTYRFGRLAPILSGLEGSLSAINLFDRAPPYALGAGFETHGANFDSTNASAIGRFVSLTLRQRF